MDFDDSNFALYGKNSSFYSQFFQFVKRTRSLLLAKRNPNNIENSKFK